MQAPGLGGQMETERGQQNGAFPKQASKQTRTTFRGLESAVSALHVLTQLVRMLCSGTIIVPFYR